ncbi:hypothetical protein FOXG_07006 [Fusarium oxysporum f. sp. lycopersici 4287]|uniref:BZIP domain-containing protein n=2 Tax=Fusarium oxysporum TaxID=5507 RepID=A0A0J9V519_FUSO4|nr:hypothetical protein FOXG_07006 [Fusarium oxysporum f. sp. lycopersici 4287]KAJ9419716.1 hypothetical protein QL093DRAFT_1459692 [Fusarium oxysporum]KNB06228.1 hypothetical protein FOXG_07006 [Fusarium oxysporum f. sp. lycopersici 4287]
MGTVYPPFQQATQQSLGDGTQPFDPDMSLMTQDPTDMNLCGTFPQGSWEQWWSPEDAVFAESANMAAPNVYAQQQPQYSTYSYDEDDSAQRTSPTTSMYSYPLPSPSTESTNIAVATGDSKSRRGSSSTQTEKRKRTTIRSAASKAPRRASTRKAAKSETTVKARTRSSRAKPAPQSQSTKAQSPEPDEEHDEYSRGVQERNRIASNKFRVKKRDEAKKLGADEQDMERANRDLSSCVSNLTTQVYELKMRLLQHTDCDCHLIQDYIANEAHRYIQDLGDGQQTPATPTIYPRQHHHHQQTPRE